MKKYFNINTSRVTPVPVKTVRSTGVTQTVTHAAQSGAARGPKTPQKSRSRPAGPYLQRRGNIFYFRKRLQNIGPNAPVGKFLCLSLQTALLPEAMSRVARLLAVLQREEAKIMTEQTRQAIPTENIQVILKEILRGELTRILREQDTGRSFEDTEIDTLITRLDQRRVDLKRSARRSDYSQVETGVREAATSVGLNLPADLPNDLGRRAVNLVRDLLELEGNALDGEDARSEAASLVAQYSTQSVETFVASKVVLLSNAWDEALKLYPSKDMKGNIDAIGKVAIAYFGDIPIETVSKDKQKEFFVWMGRLPKNHGRKHGKNRFCRDAPKNPEIYNRTKNDEIADADAADDAVIHEVRSKNSISNVEKRALLSERLTPRLTLTTLRRNRDGLNRLFKAAIELGCKVPPVVLTYKEVESAVKAAAPNDPLYVRVTKPKIRMPWSEERLAAFLTSPLYTGCFSKDRRSRSGKVIIRDSLYWVPLIVMTIGSRIEEILILKRRNLVRRNGVSCLNIGLDSDQGGKTEDSQRVIPIPQLLLDLGFDDWVRNLDEEHGPLLFPDAVERATTSDITSPFSNPTKCVRRTVCASHTLDVENTCIEHLRGCCCHQSFGLGGHTAHRRFLRTFRVSFSMSLPLNLRWAKVTIGDRRRLKFCFFFGFLRDTR